MPEKKSDLMDKVVNLSKRRGFVYPGSDIYGGLANTWDYGPLGVELYNNIKQLWWKRFVQQRPDVVGLDAGILMNPKVWEASGHVSSFNDPLTECGNCHTRHRVDHLIEDKLDIKTEGKTTEELDQILSENEFACPKCGQKKLGKAKTFNLLFKTFIGPTEETKDTVYMRGETAQGMFVNFKNITDTMRVKVPFGMAQIGKAFRNEITPGNFVFRTLEFEQMEIEFYIKEEEWEKWFEYWQNEMEQWLNEIGIDPENWRIYEQNEEERAHYSKRTIDIEYNFPFGGFKELYGLAYRTDYDLKKHMEHSGVDLQYFDQAAGEKYIPHVIEPTFGVSRTFLAVLIDAYKEEEIGDGDKKETRTVLKIDKKLAPFKVAVLPLSKKEELAGPAKELFTEISRHFVAEYDETQSIGKRYRRQDEIGTPYCVTFDFDSLEDKAVTVRDRDTMQQERISIDQLELYLRKKLC